ELLINQKAFDSLPADLQAIVTEASLAASRDMHDDYVYNNALALEQLKQQGTELKRFPDEVLAAMREQSDLILGELAAQSELNGRIWAPMKAFQAQVEPMHDISERELYNWRGACPARKTGREHTPLPLRERARERGNRVCSGCPSPSPPLPLPLPLPLPSRERGETRLADLISTPRTWPR